MALERPAGDTEHLADLLAAARITLSVEQVLDFARGVAAAPASMDPTEWVGLISQDPATELVSVLDDLVAGYREEIARGVFVQPAPATRLAALRDALAAQDIQGFLVPLADEHQSEFPSQGSQRLAWLTGFSGSAGMAVVLPEKAAIFVDGRYTLQVRDQVDVSRFQVQHLTEEPPADWIATNAKTNGAVSPRWIR